MYEAMQTPIFESKGGGCMEFLVFISAPSTNIFKNRIDKNWIKI